MNKINIHKVEKLLNRVPTCIIKRGNAFSVSRITDPQKLEEEFEKISFHSITIDSQAGQTFYGAVSIKLDYMEAECDLTIECESADAEIAAAFEVNLASEEIFILLK